METPDGSLPPDVFADSGCRLPLVNRDEVDPAAQWVYDVYADPAQGSLAGLRGPGGIRLYSPPTAIAATALNRALRHHSSLSDALCELAILVTAREMDSEFEWFAHAPEAIKCGLDPSVIEVVRDLGRLTDLPEREATVIEIGRQLFQRRAVDSATFASAVRLFGRRGVVELVSLMGAYASTALLLIAVDMQLPDGVTKSLTAEPSSEMPDLDRGIGVRAARGTP